MVSQSGISVVGFNSIPATPTPYRQTTTAGQKPSPVTIVGTNK